ncbi:protein RRNAD1-like [Pecten maximus]|uniref:protein RRNAD1-like n=1 Tax=Pecten maximus TaxID=6579 RepID=UPI001458E233|nr:protein RRNAD1-like [Pecten maximus]
MKQVDLLNTVMENYNNELVLKFLEKYDWIYNFQLIKFFLDRVWENIPREWCEVLLSLSIEDLNRLPYGDMRDEWPASLKEFIRTALTLSLPRSPRKGTIPLGIDPEMRRGMTPKKQHEVSLMSSVVHDVAQRADCEVILDIGSGLGYLGQLLQKHFGYHIIGLESKQGHTSGAERRARHTTELDKLSLKQPQQFLGVCNSCQKSRCVEGQTDVLKHPPDFSSDVMVPDSKPQLERPVTLTLPRALMIGLHCCGDLTPTMMEYFQSLDFVRGLCCVSCCYHRMEVKAGNETPYNFPLSATTCKIYNKLRGDNPKWSIGTFALRLAAQETRARWGKQTAEDHDYHTKNVGYRGILELYKHTSKSSRGTEGFSSSINIPVSFLKVQSDVVQRDCLALGILELYKHTKSKNCEKAARRIARKSDFSSFTAYVEAASCRLEAEEGTGIDRAELFRLYEENKDKMRFIEPLTALQYLLQPVLEGLITTDRAQYLKEHGITTEIIPIFDEVISPRNLALISVK